MKIKWYGHAAFLITTNNGVRIIIDPYESGAFGGGISYGQIEDEADLVLTSHEHEDHNYTKSIKGPFVHIKKAGSYTEKGVTVRALPVFHDKTKGKERGENLIFVVSEGGITLAHLGDLGHTLDDNILKSLGKVEILLMPVGGFFTIDAHEATKIMNDIGPLLTVPMHYSTDKTNMPIEGVQAFIEGKTGVREINATELTVTKETLPKINEIIVMKHAL